MFSVPMPRLSGQRGGPKLGMSPDYLMKSSSKKSPNMSSQQVRGLLAIQCSKKTEA